MAEIFLLYLSFVPSYEFFILTRIILSGNTLLEVLSMYYRFRFAFCQYNRRFVFYRAYFLRSDYIIMYLYLRLWMSQLELIIRVEQARQTAAKS